MNYTIRPITTISDPALPHLFDIYQRSFPLVEQMPISFWWKYLIEKEAGENTDSTLVVYETPECPVAGFAFWQMGTPSESGEKAACLWYIATAPGLRGGGVGKKLYEYVADSVFSDAQCHALVMEVELPDEARVRSGEEAATYAERRLSWYRRNGVKQLTNISYSQSVGWQPEIEMSVLIHPSPNLPNLTAEQALLLGNSVLDEGINTLGPPELV